jgi:hypothetical protein
LTDPRRRLRALARGSLLAAAALLALCGGAWALRLRPPVPPPAGARAPLRAYDLAWRTRAGLRAGTAGAQGWILDGRGRLLLKRYGDGAVAARLEDAQLTVADAAVTYRGLERPFSFREDARGYLSGFAFAPGLPEETRSLLRQAVALVQVVSPERARDRWQVRERDALGVFRATYERLDPAGLRVRKRKLEYLPEPPPDGGGAPLARQVIGGETTLELTAPAGDLARAHGSEVLHTVGPGGLAFEEATAFTIERADVSDGFPATFAALQAERDRAFGFTAPPAPAAGAGPAVPDSLEAALRGLVARRGRDRAASEAAVTAWLRVHPGAPRALVEYLDACSRGARTELDAAAQAALFRLLAGAATPESLDALLDAATDAGRHPRTRALAVAHMDRVPVARPEQVDALLSLSERERAVDGDGELATSALLVTGALGHRELAPPEVSARVVEALEARLAGADDAASRRAAVLAMGNCADPRLAASLDRALADPAPDVRAAAAHALRRLDAADAVPRLLARYAGEPAPEVRAALVRTLARHAGRDDVLAWARGELLVARDTPSLVALAELVGSTAARAPASANALRALLARRPGREVERVVLRFVPPRG